MKVVAFVPIKLNSQRLKNKNILQVLGKPMCWHICDTLLQVKEIDETYVFCSDEKVRNYIPDGVGFLKRDRKLDGNLVKGMDIYQAFIEKIEADVYVLAHTTSPFLKAYTIQEAIKNVLYGEFDSAFSARRIQTFAWHDGEPINYELSDIPRTQDIEPVFIETSGFYIFKKEVFNQYRQRIGKKPFMQEVSDIEGIDIDEAEDYERAVKLSELL